MNYRIPIILCCLLSLFSCQEPPIQQDDTFDRGVSLRFMAESIIIPAWENYHSATQALVEANSAFSLNPSNNTLNDYRESFKIAWLAWQDVSMFDIGKAEELKVRNYTNLYPTDTELINEHILTADINLSLPSTYAAQGFPALDYLLYGLDSETQIVASLSKDNVIYYLSLLTDKLHVMSSAVLEDWKGDYKNDFISNDGSSATSSYDKIVNDFLIYYEKYLRAGKVGIPAGVFSISSIPTNTEAYYSSISNKLFQRGFQSTTNFFNGKGYGSENYGPSLITYIKHIQDISNLGDITEQINANWENVSNLLADIDTDFASQIMEDKVLMLELFDALQANVILLKVDMLQMLNIQVDFVDADGD